MTQQQQTTSPGRDDTIRRALLRAYVNKNYEKYQSLWNKAASRPTKQSWNWAAFFLSLGWLAYRKMYGLSALWIGLLLLELVASMVFGYSERYSNAFGLGLAFAAGQVGNLLYERQANKQVDQVKASLPSTHWVSTLRTQGGVSWAAGAAAWVIYLLLWLLVSLVAQKL
ncbi:DUF2628 domain-containing protein [Comamonas sp.]|uniref:DUF2628 domain-containing protein n=1 Tax=Comamonas sp. TaxID=34028 RepID=UPI0028AE203B|nr:DUF2628 domain-containing protein [Comamonas sp.]